MISTARYKKLDYRTRMRSGRHAVAVTDRERPYTEGSVGAYTEDARAEFRDITVPAR